MKIHCYHHGITRWEIDSREEKNNLHLFLSSLPVNIFYVANKTGYSKKAIGKSYSLFIMNVSRTETDHLQRDEFKQFIEKRNYSGSNSYKNNIVIASFAKNHNPEIFLV